MTIIKAKGTKLTILYSVTACTYIPILYLLANCTQNVYEIRKLNYWMLLLTIFTAEGIKVSFNLILTEQPTITRDLRGAKVKKYPKIKEALKCTLLLCIMTLVYFMIIVLLGAPFLDSHEETLTLSVLLILLTIYPCCVNIGSDSTIAMLFGNKPPHDSLSDMLRRNMVLALFGAWCGAVFVPLDWDRPWQKWPLPCCVGAIIGSLVSDIFTLLKSSLSAFQKYISKPKKNALRNN